MSSPVTQLRKDFSIRRAIIPKPECVLLCIDFSQIEYRLLAHFSGDKRLLKTFLDGEDIHSSVACLMFGAKKETLTKDQRYLGKKFNFAQLYGSGPETLAEQCQISIKKVHELNKRYYRLFPGVARFKERTFNYCRQYGGVRNPFGRWRSIPAQLAYIGVNTLIQSTAADIFKVAIVRVNKYLSQRRSRVLLPVHDEIVINWDMSDGVIIPDILRLMTTFEVGGKPMFRVPIEGDVSVCKKSYQEKEEIDVGLVLEAETAGRGIGCRSVQSVAGPSTSKTVPYG